MFFLLSKLLYYLILPFSWICIAFIWFFLSNNPRRKNQLSIFCLLTGLVFSNGYLANKALSKLEFDTASLNEEYELGILLTGITRHGVGVPNQFHLMDGADRLTETIRLYNAGTIKKILISGGAADIHNPKENEGINLVNLALDLGVEPNDIILENQSKNTYENAKYSAPMVRAYSSSVLITSAFHMRRAEACFAKQNLSPALYAVDFQTPDKTNFSDFLPSTLAFQKWDIVIKEIVGLSSYWMMGYI